MTEIGEIDTTHANHEKMAEFKSSLTRILELENRKHSKLTTEERSILEQELEAAWEKAGELTDGALLSEKMLLQMGFSQQEINTLLGAPEESITEKVSSAIKEVLGIKQ